MTEEQPAEQERPLSVSDLRKKFEGKGKAQTPLEYSNQGRASAARHNLTVRMQQVAWNKAENHDQPNPLQDPRLSGLTDAEVKRFVLDAASSSNSDFTKAVADVLNADVQVGDPDVDQMTVKELQEYILLKKGENSDCKKMADLRLRALRLKQHQTSEIVDAEVIETEEYAFYIPQLTTALTSGTEQDVNRAILQMFFEEFDPSRLSEIDQLLESHKGEEDELFAELAWKYPDHANKIVAFSINATYADSSLVSVPTASTIHTVHNIRRPSYVISALRM